MPITSSSISSSEAAAPAQAVPWIAFATRFALAAAALLALILATAYAIDPYDSGRSTLFAKPGVRPQGPRTANASRGRDPAFDAAVIGNSRVQLLSPDRLKAETGVAFVQLSVPRSGPREQLVLLDWFMRHRPRPAGAVVLGVDALWCTADPTLPLLAPFPFWLYTRSALDYVGGLVRFDVLEEVPRRMRYVFAANPARARPDGYWDYAPEYLRPDDPGGVALRGRLEGGDTRETPPIGERFPAMEALRRSLASLPAEVPVVLVLPPLYAKHLPQPGSEAAAAQARCKAAAVEAAASRPRTAVVDWRTDRPETRDPASFFDAPHYREPVARMIERDVAEALRRLR